MNWEQIAWEHRAEIDRLVQEAMRVARAEGWAEGWEEACYRLLPDYPIP
jgi:hypothetical protein